MHLRNHSFLRFTAKVLVFLLMAVLVVADDDDDDDDNNSPGYNYNAPQQDSDENEEGYGKAKYEFSWAVKDDDSGNDFGQHEARSGEQTDGSFYVHLPDDRLQKVTYRVHGKSGFIADVTYEGEARYPDSGSQEEEEGYEYTTPEVPSGLYEAP
ncbi:uncharacterized protein LOC143037141 [Oratosquilla oratoria]|uniref:uncharacterized protein LOC143037141 n=1 Tax=Oratosquilla oratoria TaxID=337810 RepID=UPI003F7596B2